MKKGIGFLIKAGCVLFTWVLQPEARAQEKFESEHRIHQEAVPLQAQRFIDSFTSHKVKWYEELGLESKSIEAKFKYGGRRWSVEFDSAGQIEDIEIIIKKKSFPTSLFRRIQAHLDSAYQSFRIHKIQIQYSGTAADLMQLRSEVSPLGSLVIQYELELRAKQKGRRPVMYEYTFDDKGHYLFHKTILLRNADHLEF